MRRRVWTAIAAKVISQTTDGESQEIDFSQSVQKVWEFPSILSNLSERRSKTLRSIQQPSEFIFSLTANSAVTWRYC